MNKIGKPKKTVWLYTVLRKKCIKQKRWGSLKTAKKNIVHLELTSTWPFSKWNKHFWNLFSSKLFFGRNKFNAKWNFTAAKLFIKISLNFWKIEFHS